MDETCTVPDCQRSRFARDLCSPHYQKAKYHGTLPPRVLPVRDCEHCGKTFQGVRRNVRFCSADCAYKAKYQRRAPERIRDTCRRCGASLLDRSRKAQFCSDQCCTDFYNEVNKQKRWADIEASRKPCRGCSGDIPAGRQSNAQYCSDECKIRSRRHQAYGLTKVELDVLLAQHEQCAICDTTEWGKKGPQVDHCHATGRVRGILCSNCNQGLGRFADDTDRLASAIRYIKQFQ